MPTVLQVNVCANYRSTGRIAEDIGQLVLARGWRSIIAYGDSVRASRSELIRIGSRLDLLEHGFETRLFDNHGLASRRATKDFLKRVDVIRPDIIHLHNIHGYYLNYPELFEFLSNINVPVVWTLHDCWPFTGHCAYFDFTGCTKWITECKAPCPGRKQYPASFWLDLSNRNYRLKKACFQKVKNLTLVPVSNWLGELLGKSFLSKYPIEVIHNGICIDSFSPVDGSQIRTKYGIGDSSYIIGVASVWDYRKGFEAFIKLKKQMSDDVKIVLIGLNEKQLHQTAALGIIGIPHTESTNELAALYSEAMLFCNLTYEDNYPTTNLEAMACGTPVLTFDSGGSVEAVTKDTGWVVEKGDLGRVISIIGSMKKKDQREIEIQRKACHSRALVEFDKRKAFDHYLKLYEQLIH